MSLASAAMIAFGTPYIRDALKGYRGIATGMLSMGFAGLLTLSIFTFIAIKQEDQGT